jgi:hypothetical protein
LGFPWRDPQFWLATAVFILAAAWLLRGVLPVPILSKRRKAAKAQRRVSLTVGGKPPRKGA